MRRLSLIFLLLSVFLYFHAEAQNKGFIAIKNSKFITGDDPSWSKPDFDDSSWKEIQTGKVWQAQGYDDYHGYAWYRIHVTIPSSLKENSTWKDSLRIFLAHVNDVDYTYFNGTLIGHIGAFPEEEGGYVSMWPAIRDYHLSVNNPLIKWDQENIIAIRDYDGGGTGGIFMGNPYIDMLEKIDGIDIAMESNNLQFTQNKIHLEVNVKNIFNTETTGTLSFTIENKETNNVVETKSDQVLLTPFGNKSLNFDLEPAEGLEMSIKFIEEKSNLEKEEFMVIPYILTPPVADAPRINGALRLGVRPGSPFMYKIPATGESPLTYSVKKLPKGLSLDKHTGLITGKFEKPGDYLLEITVKNSAGNDKKTVLVKVGDLLALTPPMGWNSWNCWGLSVSDAKVKSSAQAMVDKGLASHGWTYINIDDGWEAPERAGNGEIVPNEKFPDMKALGDFLHNRGLKFGIYSSPGPKTCGGYLGTYQHEVQDANIWASWGIDYIKYDLCSYGNFISKENRLEEHQKPYIVMREALKQLPRDIVYSMCQYGLKNVWEWGPDMNGNLWRTTGDITDTWQSLSRIGFNQNRLSSYAKPGRWNDPDMLIVGMVGWGENLHPTRLNAYEQYTHISLWSMLSAPLLLGCDLARLDPFTLNLLTNDEVIAIDQDPLGKEATRVVEKEGYQIWKKELADGNVAIGIFNLSDKFNDISFSWSDLGMNSPSNIRNLWTQKDEGNGSKEYTTRVPWHGVKLIKVFGSNN